MDSLTPLCDSVVLQNGGEGVRFELTRNGRKQPAFVIRYQDRVYAYLNLCAHRGVELDWEPGNFFDMSHQFLICATHGALYDPSTGICVRGPCAGMSLVNIRVTEADGRIWLHDSEVMTK